MIFHYHIVITESYHLQLFSLLFQCLSIHSELINYAVIYSFNEVLWYLQNLLGFPIFIYFAFQLFLNEYQDFGIYNNYSWINYNNLKVRSGYFKIL